MRFLSSIILRYLFLSVLGLAAWGCGAGTGSACGTCVEGAGCASDGQCRKLCNSSLECAVCEGCTGGMCMPLATCADAALHEAGPLPGGVMRQGSYTLRGQLDPMPAGGSQSNFRLE